MWCDAKDKKMREKNRKHISPPSSRTISPFPYPLSQTFTCRSKTEVIVSHTNELMLWHSDSSSLWPEIDPRLLLQSENLHLQHHRLLHRAPSNTTGRRQKRCKTTALLKRNTATCRREIYQLLLSVLFFRRSKLFISTQPGPVTFPQLLTYTAPWVYYKTIPLEQPGVKCFVQGQGGNNFSRGSNHQTFPNHISHHHQNTILPEEKNRSVAHDLFRCTKVKWFNYCLW